MPITALFYPRNACLMFRAELYAICTGLVSTVKPLLSGSTPIIRVPPSTGQLICPILC